MWVRREARGVALIMSEQDDGGEILLSNFVERFRDNPGPIVDAFAAWYERKRKDDPETWTEELTWKDWLHAMSAFLLAVAGDLPMIDAFPPIEHTSTRYIIPVDLMPTPVPPVRAVQPAPTKYFEGEDAEERITLPPLADHK